MRFLHIAFTVNLVKFTAKSTDKRAQENIMFTINGKTAYSRAFLVFETSTRNPLGARILRRKKQSCQVVHTEPALNHQYHQYPQEIGSVIEKIPSRPLWLLKLGPTWHFLSPEADTEKPEDLFSARAAKALTFVDLNHAKDGVKEIRLTDYHSQPKLIMSIMPRCLTLEQTAQLVSGQIGLSPKEIELKLTADCTAFWGFVTYHTEDGTVYRRTFPLCGNFAHISYPFQLDEFGKIRFISAHMVYDTLFELNSDFQELGSD